MKQNRKRGSTKTTRIKPGVQYYYDETSGAWLPVPTSNSNQRSSAPSSVHLCPNSFILRWPLEAGFVITQNFQQHQLAKIEHGYKYYNGGLDLAFFDVREIAPILAAADGILKSASYSALGYGNVVYLDHLNGFVTIYAHLQGFGSIIPGNIVTAVDVVGYLGHTGNCVGSPGNPEGVHLHFELRYNGVPIDPMPYFK